MVSPSFSQQPLLSARNKGNHFDNKFECGKITVKIQSTALLCARNKGNYFESNFEFRKITVKIGMLYKRKL